MIFLDDSVDNTLCCIAEGIYLGEKFSDRYGNSDIIINPSNVKYITGKIIIINRSDYPKELYDILKSNGGNNIISRVKLDYIDLSELDPYQIQVEFRVMWNGVYVDVADLNISEITQKLEDCIIFNSDKGELYFPKLLNIRKELLKDEEGNITSLGWLMHQVGINVTNSVFQDLDVLKMKKLLF